MNLVIVDNSYTFQRVLEHEFKELGAKLLLSTSRPEEVESVFKNQKVDILVTSVELDGMNGLHLAQKIRQDSPNTIICVMSSYINREFYNLAYDVGVDLVVNKKFHPYDIHKCFRRILAPETLQRRIMVIDDSGISREILKRGLIKAGYMVEEASSAETAMQILEAIGDEILMVVSDENMDGRKGSELCYDIRRIPKLASIPFFLMSADSEEHLKELSKDSNINSYLEKPISPMDLILSADILNRVWQSPRVNFKKVHLQNHSAL